MGTSYFTRNLQDFHFLLFEQLQVQNLLARGKYRRFKRQDLEELLAQTLHFAQENLGATLQESDRLGCRYEEGKVLVPPSFHECWRELGRRGWVGLSNNPEFGGLGLPRVVGAQINEFFLGANLALGLFPLLAAGNGRLIETFGNDQDRRLFVRNMYTGVWGGTMCLTEPESGSDVGWLKTAARPDPRAEDRRIYRIEGRKQFITTGEHDLTENIIHLVLARIEGAPHGTKGVSLFVVPKIWVKPDGSLGEGNDVFCNGIERKMGLHGSPTCRLEFGRQGHCRGILLGEPHSGMAKMFQMMNEARLGTGLMALASAASAYERALAYAKVRHQGPLFSRHRGERVRIIEHEDVRRMLMNLKSGCEALRAMLGKTYLLEDLAAVAQEPDQRAELESRLALFTPLAKAYATDLSFTLIRDAIQIHGGAGYCSEFPVEQYARDCKITSIWEGTSYIQALDLVRRKLARDGGESLRGWLGEVTAFAGQHQDDPDFGPDMALLSKAAEIGGSMALKYLQYVSDDRLSLIPLTATRFLETLAEVLCAQSILEQGLAARRALPKANGEKAAFYQGKMAAAKFFCRNRLVEVHGRQAVFEQEDTSALDIPEEGY